MPNPQKQLYQMLAESARRGQDIERIHSGAVQQIPAQTESMRARLAELRQQIQAAGIGANPQLEDEYLKLLRHAKALDAVHALTSSPR